ncbi:hypothetical protein M378DRAFT_163884 [Amanita muscaria Koide BX008]|uniref:F-box domain-containing protein n=1 Tax=Amanita muscaria (strain Koide BX008) TaxID=946122 RepID=A0A0C2X3W7_AMAMK|nr:hypothetical protein M378DRAFT_163884 [Amanita muscaria Koide BX008]
MIGILDLPAEVLKEILCFCDPMIITETCCDFLSIAHSIPCLWSSIQLGPGASSVFCSRRKFIGKVMVYD